MSTWRNGLVKSSWHFDRWIWQRCSSKRALLLFLVLIVLALAARTLLPQIPAHLRADPIGYQERLSTIQVQFKNWTPFLEAIGAFYIDDTVWFRVLMAILAFLLLVSLGSEIGNLLTQQPVRQPEEFYRAIDAHSVSGSLPPDQAVEAARETIQHARVRRETEGDRVYLYGSRAMWARVGTAATYLGLLFLAVGLASNGQWGWQQADVQIPPDEPIAIGPNGDHHLQLVGINTEPVDSLEMRVNGSRPLHVRWGARVRRGSFRYQWVSKGGPFVQIRALRADGERLTLYNYEPRPMPVETLHFAFSPQAPPEEADRLFIVAETKVVGRLAWLNRDAENAQEPRFRLWTFAEDGRTPLADREFAASESGPSGDTLTAQLDDVTYMLDVTRYVVVDVAYQPGQWALWIGGILLAGGLLLDLIPRRQTWMLVQPGDYGTEIRMRDQAWGLMPQRQLMRAHAQLRDYVEGIRQSATPENGAPESGTLESTAKSTYEHESGA